MGVRIRLGTQWRGLPWEAIDRVMVRPRRGVLHDGRLIVTLHQLQRTVEGLDGRARRHAQLNQKLYGAALAVPLGLTTRVNGEDGHGDDLAARVTALSQGRTEVVTLLDEPSPRTTMTTTERAEMIASADERPVFSDDAPPVTDRRPRWLRRAQEAADADAEVLHDDPAEHPAEQHAADDLGEEPPADPDPIDAPEEAPATLGTFRVVDVVDPVEERASKVRAIAKLGDPVVPLVIGDFEPEPAYDPVIGPELAAARTRVGLSVDELADRTRIRPHVIESIEVDDFSPCGGDFYARGHIRTLARVLGKDPVPMLEQFDDRYATAPINARRVFEAELATGMTGSMRSTVGGPNWALLVGAVLMLVLVWSGVRLFAGDSQEVLESPPPVLNGSAGLSDVYGDQPAAAAPKPVATTLSAVNAGTRVEVRDGDGALVFEGDLVIGEVKRIEVDPPITVTSDNGGALSVMLGTRDMGFLGEPDQPATQVFQRPHS
jgi:cytoskeletal protein RodZ